MHMRNSNLRANSQNNHSDVRMNGYRSNLNDKLYIVKNMLLLIISCGS